MTSAQKSLLLLLFFSAALLRVTLGAAPAAGHALSSDAISLPQAPPGWSVDNAGTLSAVDGTVGRTARYTAPDGSAVTLFCRAAWPDRRTIPGPFYPNDCNYLGQGWDFEVRGANLALAPGATGNRIVVHQGKERLQDLSAYACGGDVIGSWHVFKWRLMWQRIRRERRPWVKVAAIGPAEGEAAAGAPALVYQAAYAISLATR